MADKIQFRRDTAARWSQFNPILLEGEMGIVSDNPNQYKIGDGEHAWNDLPLRGFTGTVVQETGSDENTVMSQKATTDKFTELENQIDYLVQEENSSDIGVNLFNKNSISFGYIKIDGTVINDKNFVHSNYIKAESNTSYVKSLNEVNIYTAFYDSNFNFLSTTNQNPFTTPENARYFKVSFNINFLESFLIQEGSEITYKGTIAYTKEKRLLDKINRNNVLKAERFIGYKNLLDLNGIVKDKYLNNGIENVFIGFCISKKLF